MIKELAARGVKQRFVTEVNTENARHCKELAKYVELRHIDGVMGNFGIVDNKEYGAAAHMYDVPSQMQFIYSNVKAFVDQQQYFFETLWSKAMPAVYKIREIEEGIPVEETEVIEGTEAVFNKLVDGFSKIRLTFDNCIDASCPSAYVATAPVWEQVKQLNQRGVKIRFISEITKENIAYCKAIMEIAELRHLDQVKGNFGIADKKDYRAVANMEEGRPPTQAIRSTVKSFVDQQQYFFETLWNRAMPAEKKMREIEEGVPPEITEIWYGPENILKKSWEIISTAKVSSDYCHNSKSPSIFVKNEQYLQAIERLSKIGVRHRFVTEITKENVRYCKELAKYVELRHLDGIKGNFAIIDGKNYGATADLSEFQPPSEFIYSNSKEFVGQQQYFFETLWNRSVPAAKKIRELEDGIPIEVTEIWYGIEEITRRQLQIISSTQTNVDYCHSAESPSILVSFEPYMRIIIGLSKRGVKQRLVTEITKENIDYCRKLAKFMEVRHLDGVEGNLGIIDRKIYGAIAKTEEYLVPSEFIYSNAKSFVDQQQHFFETLWNKAIPAEQRMIELEEGRTPETVETFSNPAEIQKLANQLVRSAEKEVLIVFASQREFFRQQKNDNGYLTSILPAQKRTAKGKSKQSIDVRITVPGGANISPDSHSPGPQNRFAQAPNSSKVRWEVRYVDVGLSTEVTVLVVDRKHSLVMEFKEKPSKHAGSDGEKYHEPGKSKALAIYTNSKGLVISTVSMFELLWSHIDLYEELKLRDIAQKEFINIAAHELRGPLQPILGLADEIRARQHHGKHGKLLSVILDSAANLQKLSNNILDVARIENKTLRLEKTNFDLNELITTSIQNFENELVHKPKLIIQAGRSSKHLLVYADRDRIDQVFFNLLANAVKFTDEGTISISAKKRDNDVEVSIRDSGRGIDPEVLPRLFTKFATSGGGSKGTGLGLFISQKIVEAHGGQLYGINNEPHAAGGGGATFTFILPIESIAETH